MHTIVCAGSLVEGGKRKVEVVAKVQKGRKIEQWNGVVRQALRLGRSDHIAFAKLHGHRITNQQLPTYTPRVTDPRGCTSTFIALYYFTIASRPRTHHTQHVSCSEPPGKDGK